jgi:selenocysteine lyase/cysteine desulfurase
MIDSTQKEKYSLPEDITYLNTAYSAPLSKEAELIGINALKEKSRPYNNTGADFFEPIEKLKTLFAELIDAPDPQSIAVIPSVSYGISIVANNVCLKEGDEIVVIGEQFPSNIYAWKRVANKYKALVKTVDAPDTPRNRGQLWNENLLDAITEKTAVIAIPNVHWADGTIFDLKAVRKKATENNALLIIDGTQSVGAFPFSIQEIKPDALVCAGYKWLMGPYALGIAYFGEHFNNGTPLEENWINRKNSENFAGLVNYEDDYKEGAYRYNMGEMSNFNLVPILTKTIEQLIEWTPESIQTYCEKITSEAIEELRIMHCFIEEDEYRAKHLFGIKLADNMDMEKLQDEFKDNNIFVSVRGEYIRVSPHVFNTKEDLQKLVNCFRLCVSF